MGFISLIGKCIKIACSVNPAILSGITGILLVALCNQFVRAQEGKVNFRDITIDQGLPNNTVFCITQDKQGFLWFATADGLVRYDGHNCKTDDRLSLIDY